MFVLRPWHRAIWIAVFASIAASVLAWFAWQDPAINFLRRDSRAEWVVLPTAADPHAHWFASLDATFRREFVLIKEPGTARLSVRAMRRAEVEINGLGNPHSRALPVPVCPWYADLGLGDE